MGIFPSILKVRITSNVYYCIIFTVCIFPVSSVNNAKLEGRFNLFYTFIIDVHQLQQLPPHCRKPMNVHYLYVIPIIWP